MGKVDAGLIVCTVRETRVRTAEDGREDYCRWWLGNAGSVWDGRSQFVVEEPRRAEISSLTMEVYEVPGHPPHLPRLSLLPPPAKLPHHYSHLELWLGAWHISAGRVPSTHRQPSDHISRLLAVKLVEPAPRVRQPDERPGLGQECWNFRPDPGKGGVAIPLIGGGMWVANWTGETGGLGESAVTGLSSPVKVVGGTVA